MAFPYSKRHVYTLIVETFAKKNLRATGFIRRNEFLQSKNALKHKKRIVSEFQRKNGI